MKNKKSVVFSILLCLILSLLLMSCDPNVEGGTFRIVGYAMDMTCYETPGTFEDDIPEEPNLAAFGGTDLQAGCPFYIVVESYLAPDEDIVVTGGLQGKLVVTKIEAMYHLRGEQGPYCRDEIPTALEVEPGGIGVVGFPMFGDCGVAAPASVDVIFEVSAEYAGVTYKDSKRFTIYLY